MKAMNDHYSISELCEAFDVSRSGYHAWIGREPCARARADAKLAPLIEAAHTEGRREYGSPRVMRWLQKRGHRCGRQRIGRLMRQMGLSHRHRRRFKPMSLTDSNHDLPVAPNLLSHRRPTLQPNAVWVADITYVPTDEGWLYVAGVLDRCTRRCVGWAFDDTLATTLPLAALDMALTQRKPPAGLVHHSDRGVQYASHAYRQRLAQAGVVPSMSRRGNCYDNAMMESFWSTLKRGLIHGQTFATRAQARAAIFEWIEVFYNRVRFHSALGCQSPVDFETQLN
jgi:transposase InsO family protein